MCISLCTIINVIKLKNEDSKGTFDLNFGRKTLLNDHAFAFTLISIREH